MKYLIQNRHWNIIEDYNIDKLLYLLVDRPDDLYDPEWPEIGFSWNNTEYWLHRDYDLPTVIWTNNEISWFSFNVSHRINNKPSRILEDGRKKYYINGQCNKIESNILK